MDIKKRVRDRINELDRDKEKLRKKQEQETAKENKNIQAENAQADILEKFIKETVKPCFEKVKEDLHLPDFLCEIEPIPDKQGRLYAIKIKFSLVNHDKSFYLKYEGKAGSNLIKREIYLGYQSSLSRIDFPIDNFPSIIEKHIEHLIETALPK